MFCKECGTKINDDAKFCSRCGTSIAPNPNYYAKAGANATTQKAKVTTQVKAKASTQELPSKPSEGISFTLKGRIDSKVYWKYMAIVLPLNLFIIFLSSKTLTDEGVFLLFLITIPALCFNVIADVRRFHDFNITGWAVIPVYIASAVASMNLNDFRYCWLTVAVALVISRIPSTEGANKYGSKSNVI